MDRNELRQSRTSARLVGESIEGEARFKGRSSGSSGVPKHRRRSVTTGPPLFSDARRSITGRESTNERNKTVTPLIPFNR